MQVAKSVQQIKPSYIREMLSAACKDEVISLAGGLPDQQTFPIELMRPAIEKLCSMPELFQYGGTVGYAPLVKYLTELYQLPQNHKAMVTTGSQQGLDLIARAYMDPNDIVVMESPSYSGAMQVFKLCEANIVTVPQTDNGPDLEKLEACFANQAVKLFYAVPDFHNPTGICWSLEVRKKVAELCIQYNITLVEDAPYREIRFAGEELPMVSSFCPDISIVLRSFSKIASPGLRIGVVTGAKHYLDPMLMVKEGADLHSSVPMQAVLLSLLQGGQFEQHIDTIKQLYKTRYNALYQLLIEELPTSCKVSPVEGGMFMWVSLPKCDPYAVATTLLEHNVAVVPSSVFYIDEAKPALRLNFTNSTPQELEQAAKLIGKVVSELV